MFIYESLATKASILRSTTFRISGDRSQWVLDWAL